MENFKPVVATLPHTPGVYIFKNKQQRILYIGKAVDLARRVRQYFYQKEAIGPKTKLLVSQSHSLETITTISEFDALLLEASLIRQHEPKYNVIAKDGKSALYIAFTLSEELPRILFIRKSAIDQILNPHEAKTALFGPFQSARLARSIMRDLRRVVPYCTQRRRSGQACFYTHLGLCAPCPSVIVAVKDTNRRKQLTARYRRNLFRLRDILSGKTNGVLAQMEAEMRGLAERREFEKAAVVRSQIENLQQLLQTHYDPTLYVQAESFIEETLNQELRELRRILKSDYPALPPLVRIEGVDVSNLGSSNPVGSFVTLLDGRIDSDSYRRFKIRHSTGQNDVAMIREVIARRLSHPEWAFPDLLVVDGGKGQLAAAVSTIKSLNLSLAVIGLAKRQEEIIVPRQAGFVTIRLPLAHPALHLLQRLRDEAHRFALSYHRKLRWRGLLARSDTV